MSQDTTFNISSFSSFPDADPIEITSVADFIDKITQIKREDDTEVFYRGHADKSWGLRPSIFRTPNGVENEHLLFRDMVARLPQSFSDCKSALDYLVQMQHYELPTRLLDVSTNPFVALYFACQSAVGDLASAIYRGVIKAMEFFEKLRSGPSTLKFLEWDEHDALLTSTYLVAALAAAAPGAPSDFIKEVASMILANDTIKTDRGRDLASFILDTVPDLSKEATRDALFKDGVVYVFSVPEDRVKHYDSDTVSVLANLAKCSDQEIDVYTEEIKDMGEGEALEKFNKQAGIRILLHQINEEKPYFKPLIRPNDLGGIFLVKAKYGNPRIINQAGAFFIFGLELCESGDWLTKRVEHEIPSDWVRHKFIIPKDKKQDILTELARIGITESYLFPKMDKYAKELKKRYNL